MWAPWLILQQLLLFYRPSYEAVKEKPSWVWIRTGRTELRRIWFCVFTHYKQDVASVPHLFSLHVLSAFVPDDLLSSHIMTIHRPQVVSVMIELSRAEPYHAVETRLCCGWFRLGHSFPLKVNTSCYTAAYSGILDQGLMCFKLSGYNLETTHRISIEEFSAKRPIFNWLVIQLYYLSLVWKHISGLLSPHLKLLTSGICQKSLRDPAWIKPCVQIPKSPKRDCSNCTVMPNILKCLAVTKRCNVSSSEWWKKMEKKKKTC